MAEPPRVPQRRHSARATSELFHSLRAEVALYQYSSSMAYRQGCEDTEDKYLRWHAANSRYLTVLLAIALLILSVSLLAAWVWS